MGKFTLQRYRTTITVAAGARFGNAPVLTSPLNGRLKGISINVPEVDAIQVNPWIMGPRGERLFSQLSPAISETPYVLWNESGNSTALNIPMNLAVGDVPIKLVLTMPPDNSIGEERYAQGVLTWSTVGNFADNDTVTINGPFDKRTYRFKTVLAKKNDVLIGGTGALSLLNLFYAITRDETAGIIGVKYHIDTPVNDQVTAHDPTGENFIEVKSKNDAPGPMIAVSKSAAQFTWDDTTFTELMAESAERSFIVDLFIDRGS